MNTKRKDPLLKHLLKNKRGASLLLMVFIAITLLVFLLAAFETIKVFSIHFTVETNLQRLANNVVEGNIDDEYRADGYNYLVTAKAEQQFIDDFHWYTMTVEKKNDFLQPEGGVIYGCRFSENDDFLYMIHITELIAERETATFRCKGKVYIANSVPGLMDKFVFDLDIYVESTNFRIDTPEES